MPQVNPLDLLLRPTQFITETTEKVKALPPSIPPKPKPVKKWSVDISTDVMNKIIPVAKKAKAEGMPEEYFKGKLDKLETFFRQNPDASPDDVDFSEYYASLPFKGFGGAKKAGKGKGISLEPTAGITMPTAISPAGIPAFTGKPLATKPESALVKMAAKGLTQPVVDIANLMARFPVVGSTPVAPLGVPTKESVKLKPKIKEELIKFTPEEEAALEAHPYATGAAYLVGSALPYAKAYQGLKSGFSAFNWFKVLSPAKQGYVINTALMAAAQGADEQSFEGMLKGGLTGAAFETAFLGAGKIFKLAGKAYKVSRGESIVPPEWKAPELKDIISPKKIKEAASVAMKAKGATIPEIPTTKALPKGKPIIKKAIKVQEPVTPIIEKTPTEPEFPSGIREDVQKTIDDAQREVPEISLQKPELATIVEAGKKVSYALKPQSEQLPKGAYNLIYQLQKEAAKNLSDVQRMVGEKLTKPNITKILSKVFPYSNPSDIQNKARALRNIPFIGKYFGVSGQEMKLTFKLAESIREFDAKGNPIFGTMKKTGDVRYTPEEGLAMWNAARPDVRKAVYEFAKPAIDAKDIFNRNLAKEIFNIQTDLQGYVRHMGFAERNIDRFKRIFLSLRKASPKMQRMEKAGYLEQFETATIEGLNNLLNTRSYNKFVRQFEDAITEPLASTNPLKKGWTEIKGKFGENKDRKLQIPNVLYNDYKRYAEPAMETGNAGKLLNSVGNYYKANLLLHPGTTTTNLIGQALLYTTKLTDDFYGQLVLSRNPSPIINDIRAIFKAFTPSYVRKTPEYLWAEGEQISSYIGESPGFGMAILSKLLIPFRAVDSYAKRIVYLSEAMEKMGYKEFKKATSEELFNMHGNIVKEIDNAVDLYALNYGNVPRALEKFRKAPGTFLIAPYPTYYYKFGQHVVHYLAALNPAIKMTAKDRATRIMTLSTMLSLAAYADKRLEQKASDYISASRGVTPGMGYQFEKAGRMKIGEKPEGEEYLRVAKYPWMNVYKAGEGLYELGIGQKAKGLSELEQLREESITFGAGIDLYNLVTGQRTKYERYKPGEVKAGEIAKLAVPGFRVTEGIKKVKYPEKVRPQTFIEALSMGVPFIPPKGKPVEKGITRYDPREEMMKLLYGINIRTIKPEESLKERDKIIQNMVYNLENGDLDEQEKHGTKALLESIGIKEDDYSDYIDARKQRMIESRKK